MLRSWVQIPPGPLFPVVQLRYCFEFIFGKCRTNSAVEGNNTDESEGKKDELQKEQDLAFLRKRAIFDSFFKIMESSLAQS